MCLYKISNKVFSGELSFINVTEPYHEFKGQYGDLDSSCISYGPCQTPTLGFCVSRHDQISSFKPEKYWRISLSVKTKFGSIATEWSRGRIFDNGVANLFFNRVKKGKGI